MYLKYVNTVYFVFKYKIQINFEFASNTKYIACISNTYLKYLFLKYFTTLLYTEDIEVQSASAPKCTCINFQALMNDDVLRDIDSDSVCFLLQVSAMLYVFHVDTGTMLTFDMNVAMQRSAFICSL